MCKVWGRVLAVMLTLMITTGCVPTQSDDETTGTYQKMHRKFSRMQSYSARVQVTVFGNKTQQVYETEQKVKDPGFARVEIVEPSAMADVVTVYAGDRVQIQKGEEKPLIVPSTSAMQDVFVNEFFASYYGSEETKATFSGEESEGTILLETTACPERAERYKITMLLDKTALEPKVITVYDMGGNVRVKASFSDFCYNPDFEEGLFALQET